jgi:SAM-dependent methyltransferase
MNISQMLVKAEFFLQSIVRYGMAVRCPHCGVADQEIVARKFVVARVVRCNDCGLVFSRPIYRTWFSDNFYDRFYSAEGSTTELPNDADLAVFVSTGFSGTDKHAARQLSAISRVVPGRGRLLEIGSSWGYFLFQAQAAGFDVTGVEIGTTRREFGRSKLGLRLIADFADLAADERFDVIYTSHVLEHFTDISTLFGKLGSLLADDGKLFIEVPNIDVAAVGPECLSWVGAVHPLGYSARWFKENLPRHGLEVLSVHDSWEALPERSVDAVPSTALILQARRRSS